ncbi:MAG: hypothetical protein A3F12_01270 [Gammaproteobacteria bacterium RIFCSPHIGHO2_12_FULL_38_14]|nr:MAG: hypothetical protein A3F12_01270 [Gammaproteobacteria bacterium RIFCSPHIGHO2_12_FULL_38_14]
MNDKQKSHQLAVIRETECIGCTKCIDACPVDAIIGAQGQLHTVISAYCVGCNLCIPPCPVDCIEMGNRTNSDMPPLSKQETIARHQARKLRHKNKNTIENHSFKIKPMQDRKKYIEDAVKRARSKTNKNQIPM